MQKVFVSLLLVLLLTAPSFGDTLILRDGTRQSGTFIQGSSSEVTFVDRNGNQRRYSTRDVQAVEFGTSAAAGWTPGVATGATAAIEQRTIPAGSQFVIRTNETIESRSAVPGRRYSAQVVQDVRDTTGALLIPSGAPVQLAVREISERGAIGTEELILDVESVTVQGRNYTIHTPELAQRGREGIGWNPRTGQMVGGGAAVGTLLGAVAGGGRGAVIGGLLGAVAGGAVQVLTRDQEVRVPAETTLTFRLDQPMQLQPVSG
jgi:hypothetical protein